jgi:hypothetical protein
MLVSACPDVPYSRVNNLKKRTFFGSHLCLWPTSGLLKMGYDHPKGKCEQGPKKAPHLDFKSNHFVSCTFFR